MGLRWMHLLWMPWKWRASLLMCRIQWSAWLYQIWHVYDFECMNWWTVIWCKTTSQSGWKIGVVQWTWKGEQCCFIADTSGVTGAGGSGLTILGAVRNIINLNDISIENFTNNLLFGTPIVVVPCSCRVWIPVVCKIDSVKKKKKNVVEGLCF